VRLTAPIVGNQDEGTVLSLAYKLGIGWAANEAAKLNEGSENSQ
jgi:hypothetical protein